MAPVQYNTTTLLFQTKKIAVLRFLFLGRMHCQGALKALTLLSHWPSENCNAQIRGRVTATRNQQNLFCFMINAKSGLIFKTCKFPLCNRCNYNWKCDNWCSYLIRRLYPNSQYNKNTFVIIRYACKDFDFKCM